MYRHVEYRHLHDVFNNSDNRLVLELVINLSIAWFRLVDYHLESRFPLPEKFGKSTLPIEFLNLKINSWRVLPEPSIQGWVIIINQVNRLVIKSFI